MTDFGTPSPDFRYKYDYHVHTYLSPCGKQDMTPQAILGKARQVGLEAVGFADHCFGDESAEIFPRLRSELTGFDTGVKTFVGSEGHMFSPQRCSISPAVAPLLDFVMIAIGHYHLKEVEKPRVISAQAFARNTLEMIQGVCALGYADVIAHPFHILGQWPFSEAEVYALMPEGALLDCLDLAARQGVAFEFNPALLRRQPFLPGFLRMCQQMGVKLALGSDAHDLTTFGYDPNSFPDAACLRSLGFGEEDLWHPPGAAREGARL